MIKIKCITGYKGRYKGVQPLGFGVGQEIEVEDDLAEYLLADSPESFKFPKGFGSGKAPSAPPVDKQIAEPLEKKEVSELKELLREKGLKVGGRKKALIKRLREAE